MPPGSDDSEPGPEDARPLDATAPTPEPHETVADDVPAGIEPDERPEPVVDVEALGLRTRQGWVFRDVDLVAGPGELAAVFGPAGSGRSSLLLTLTGRMAATTGRARVCGVDLPGGASRVRARTAIARLGHSIGVDGTQLVTETVAEHRTMDGGSDTSFDAAAEVVGFHGRLTEQVDELPAVEQTLLHIALAGAAPADVLVVDDTESGLTPDEQDRVWQALADLAATGPVIVAASSTPPRPDVADHHLGLGGQDR